MFGLLAAAAEWFSRPPADDAERRERVERMASRYNQDFPGVEHISPLEASRRVERGAAVLVDVREPEERAVSVIPGPVTPDVIASSPEAFAGKQRIAYCTIGYRSAKFAAEQQKQGEDWVNLDGSILAWTHAGLGLEQDGQPVTRVHVYGRTWNLAPERYEAIW